MEPTARIFSALSVVVASLLFMPTAGAQDRSPSPPSTTAPSPTNPPSNISDKKLDAAAAAVKSVTAVSSTYKQKLAQAPAAEKERISNEADEAVTKAISDQGLSVDEYLAIMQVAQNDPVVRNKLFQRLH